jgi:hypothetical protein
MLWNKWLAKYWHRDRLERPPNTRRTVRHYHPCFEVLESRMVLSTFLVTNTLNDGLGSLRQAIVGANASSGMDEIQFAIGTGPQTIALSSPLPAITGSVLLDGWSQPGWQDTPLIVLDGQGGTMAGLIVSGSGSTIRGLVITNMTGGPNVGISLSGTNHRVQGNYIGTNLAGTAAGASRITYGVDINGSGHFVGTDGDGVNDALEGNLISGNFTGIWLGGNVSNVVIAGNRIGTNAAGTAAIPNADEGVRISNSVNVRVGTNADGTSDSLERNVIAGNVDTAIHIVGGSGHVIAGNYIGTTAGGNASLGNRMGLTLQSGATGVTIGGTTTAERNIISGNAGNGVLITGVGTSGNTVAGNFIGTNAAGTLAVPNSTPGSTAGVLLSAGATDNTIGGITAVPGTAAGNVISGNGNYGVFLAPGSFGNSVQGNLIGLAPDGTTALGNAQTGVYVDDSPDNLIGGTVAGAGNIISAGTTSGVMLRSAGAIGNTIAGNYIGTDRTGTLARPNAQYGIWITNAGNNTIGGTNAAARNIISGNSLDGIQLSGTGTVGNTVAGNFVGIDVTGLVQLANAMDGVHVVGGASGNLIGGTAAGAGNVISGNNLRGISISGVGSIDNVVLGNYIGTNRDGLAAIANQGHGVQVDTSAANNIIGGTTAGARNVISGNNGSGVFISSATGTVIAGNYIGTNAAGDADLGNALAGVNVVSASTTTIGGTTAASRNIISGNDASGINIHSSNATTIRFNYIGLNATGTAAVGNLGSGVVSQSNTTGTVTRDNVISGQITNGAQLGYGLQINGVIAGNIIGLNATGTAAVPNASYGISASSTTVGGTSPADRNIISGNASGGIRAGDNLIINGNYIGTDITGQLDLGNAGAGVVAEGANVTIGGFTDSPGTGAGNVIAGNDQWGIHIGTATSIGTTVLGNLIGLAADGLTPLANGLAGVTVLSPSRNATIGGDDDDDGAADGIVRARNVIAGNRVAGINLSLSGSVLNTRIQGNYIGTDRTGAIAVGNASNGGVIIGNAPGTLLGGDTPGAGNLISGNAGSGVSISGTGQATIQGNIIGLNAAGTAAIPNSNDGITVLAPTNLIGGNSTAQRNIISGNGQNGIRLTRAQSARNTISGNYIGTDITGTLDLGNILSGVLTDDGASNNFIGGTLSVQRNIISGNNAHGILITGAATSNNTVFGNYLGTNAAGTAAVGNSGSGITVSSAGPGHLIGGAALGARNIISGNRDGDNVGVGVAVINGNAAIVGNYIGTNAAGTAAIPNAVYGVIVNHDTRIGTDGDGVNDALEGNLISGNRFGGIGIEGQNNLIAGNFIGTNFDGSAAIGGQGVYGGIVLTTLQVGNMLVNNRIGTNSDGISDDLERNVISGQNGVGIHIVGGEGVTAANNTIAGNYIGLNAAGTAAIPNIVGIAIEAGARNNLIGGTTDSARNVVAGNQQQGLYIAGVGTDGNIVQGNWFGLDVTGTNYLPNLNGELIHDGPQNNLLGGITTAARNVFASGVQISGGTHLTTGNTILGNYIGTNAAGTTVFVDYAVILNATIGTDAVNTIGGTVSGAGNLIAGTEYGVVIDYGSGFVVQGNRIGLNAAGTAGLGGGTGVGLIFEANNNLLGGTTPGAGNVISGNTRAGVELSGEDVVNNLVVGNFIGTDATGSLDLGNLNLGVWIADGASSNTIGTPLNPNVIAFNRNAGVVVEGNQSRFNTIRGNVLHSNGTLEIDLANDGVTANDPSRLGTGPQDSQTYPILQLVAGGAATFVVGTLVARPFTAHTLDFYASATTDASGQGEGQRYLESTVVTTNARGVATFEILLAQATVIGEFVAATATDSAGNTSELSRAAAVLFDHHEPNDAPSAATGLGVLSLDQGLIEQQGLISPIGDRDFFRFEVRTALSAEIQVFAARDNSLLDSTLKLYDAESRLLASNDDFVGTDSLIRAALQPGVYYVEIAGFQGSVGTYRLQLFNRAFVGPQVLRMTPSTTVAVSPTTVQLLLDNNDLDVATITAQAFRLESVDAAGTPLIDYSVAIKTREYDALADRLTLGLGSILPDGRYRLTVRDTITRLNGLALDGDQRGGPGGDFVGYFGVDRTAPSGTVSQTGIAGENAGGVRYQFGGVVSDAFPAAAGEIVRVELDIDGDGFDDGVTQAILQGSVNAPFTVTATTGIAAGQGMRNVRVRFVDSRGNASEPQSVTLNTDLPVVTSAGSRGSSLFVTYNLDGLANVANRASYQVEGRTIERVTYNPSTRTAELTLAGGLADGIYQLTVLSGADGINDQGLALDGDGDGRAGASFHADVRVDRVAPTIHQVRLGDASDSGIVGDGRTNVTLPRVDVSLADIFPSSQGEVTVFLDVDGDGFDDGQATVMLTSPLRTTVSVAGTTPLIATADHTIRVRVRDQTDNVAEAGIVIQVDRQGARVLDT